MSVKKAVIVAAGYGSRLLPLTRTIPKEMLPIVDRPAIQWVIDELVEAGIDEVLIVTSRRKRCLEDWFDRDVELEAVFAGEGATGKLALARPPDIRVQFVRQVEMKGTGHAVMLARTFAGRDPVLVCYPDDLFGGDNVSSALIRAHEASRAAGQPSCVLSALRVDDEDELSRYGVLNVGTSTVEEGSAALEAGRRADDGVLRVHGIVEKPPRGTAPSNLVSLGRYLFTPDLFDHLERGWRLHGEGEFFITDAIEALCAEGKVVAAQVTARRYDTGTTAAWLATHLELALDDPDHGPALRELLRQRLG